MGQLMDQLYSMVCSDCGIENMRIDVQDSDGIPEKLQAFCTKCGKLMAELYPKSSAPKGAVLIGVSVDGKEFRVWGVDVQDKEEEYEINKETADN